MAAAAEGTEDKRRALERSRKTSRMRTLGAAFALGLLLGVGLAQLVVTLTTDPEEGPPSILAVDPPEGTFLRAGETSVLISFSEPLSGAPSITLTGPMNFTLARMSFDGRSWRGVVTVPDRADGAYLLRIAGAADLRGNGLDDVAIAYEIDTTRPTSRTHVLVNVTSAPFDITWDALDEGSGIARVEVWSREDAGAWEPLTTSSEDRGTYHVDPGVRKATISLCAVAVDRAGNREEGPMTSEASVSYNAVPPSASLAGASGYWYRTPINVSASVGPNVTSVDLRYYFAPDNATWQGPFTVGAATTNPAWTFDFPLGPGHYRLFAQAQDADGARESEQPPSAAELVAAYDPWAPIASAAAPITPYWHTSEITVSANATDDGSGVARVSLFYSYRQNGTAPWSSWTLATTLVHEPWTFPFAFPWGDGRYELTASARDAAGNDGSLPWPGDGEVSLGFNRHAPAAPLPGVPRSIDPSTRGTTLSWAYGTRYLAVAFPSPDVVRIEIHRGATRDFVLDEESCMTSSTCVTELGRDVQSVEVSLPTENDTHWFRIRVVDDGGLSTTSDPVGANFHGIGFDSADVFADATELPLDAAWSERIDHDSTCTDCLDIFQLSFAAGSVLSVRLAVPSTGDYGLALFDSTFQQIGASDVGGYGASESLVVAFETPGVYYVMVMANDGDNGWYTLSAVLGAS